MSFQLFNEVWEKSPYEGQKLLLHLALAESSSSHYGGDTGEVLPHELMRKARFLIELHLYDALQEMETEGILEYEVHCRGESYESISYTLWGYKLDELNVDETQIATLPITGYVYILRGGQYCKIGKTKDITNRLKQLAIQLPHKVELLHTIATSDPTAAERFFHTRFMDKRMNGEWFELEAGDIAQLKSCLIWHPKDEA